MRLLKRILEMLDALLIIVPKAYRLGRPQNLFKVGLELGLFSLCTVKMILDNPLQAPRPEPIPVVADWREYLAMGVLELSAGKFPDAARAFHDPLAAGARPRRVPNPLPGGRMRIRSKCIAKQLK